jgi:hypothetical protein
VNDPPKTLSEVIAEVEVSIKGLRLEVESWRQNVGSAEHFMLCEINRLLDMLERLKRSLP